MTKFFESTVGLIRRTLSNLGSSSESSTENKLALNTRS